VPIDDVEQAIDEEIERLAVGGITEDELTRAKNRAEVDFAHQIENYDTRADMMGMLATYFDDPKRILDWLEPYRAAAADDLKRVTQTYLVPENRVTSIFVPEAA
jgi:zinc protease